MRKPRQQKRRTEVRVRATETINGDWEVLVFDQAGLLAKTFCASKSNVALTATRAASTALDISEGRIKIDRVNYTR